MKGTILDFLKLANEKPGLANDLIQLAAKHDFEFIVPDEVSDDALDGVAGGAIASRDIQEMTLAKQMEKASANLAQSAIEGNTLGTAEINFVDVTDDEED